MKRRIVIKNLVAAAPAIWLSQSLQSISLFEFSRIHEPMAKGPFEPSWDSLKQYQTPDWFRDAKFGIWAHWGPQCQPEFGDWYARSMYIEGSRQYKYHIEKYGHPSAFGFKDVIHQWKAENWNPEELMELYKRAGAKYFMALANHHDNFDNYNSKYQKWNSVNLGPGKDLIGGWEKAARKNGLRFGVSVHAAHAWTWFEQSQQADKTGPFAGVPYDGKLKGSDGRKTWWSKLDPQELYAQNHPLSDGSDDERNIHKQWNWGNGAAEPSKQYCDKFYNRTADLINKYDPDLVYFDDTALPLWPVSDAGLRVAAHYYNRSIQKRGKLEVVINGKILDEEQRKCMVWDIERGQSNTIEPLPWQTDTCIGHWHYDHPLYDRHGYKTAKTVIHTLIDVVSKNGNLLLSVPVRGDGTIDADERKIVEGIAGWMQINNEAIFNTRPWKIFGEGPAIESAAPLTAQGFNEGKGKPFTHEDIRFTIKGDILFAFLLGWPGEKETVIKSLAATSPQLAGKKIRDVSLIGYHGKLEWQQTTEGLKVKMPLQPPCENAFVLTIFGAI
ncbi:MAG: alpha-L-fucosidase [Chitinophagaceae bacterium]|nr:alpha-L-fucosidase [Chitinophagaceae bacterium]